MKVSWRIEKLGDIVLIDPEQLSSFTGGNYAFYYIEISSVSSGKINFPVHNTKYSMAPSRARKVLRNNDILMSTVRPNLKSFAQFKNNSNQNYIASTGFSILRGTSSANIEFIYQSLFSQAIEKQIEVFVVGSNYPAINSSDIKKLLFKLPPLPQQQKIAKILSTVDDVIEKTENAIAKYQAMKQGMMHDLFTRGIDVNTCKLRQSDKDAPELYKDSELGLIPREWEVEELVNITKLVTDGAHFSPVPQEKGLPIGNVKDMRDSNFDYDNCTQILPEVFMLLVRQNCSPIKGDVLLSKDGTIGKVIHFEDNREIVLLSSIAIIRVNELLSSSFLSWALQSEYFDKALYALLSGSALKRITLKDILKIRIPYSKDIEEQKHIASRLQKIKNKIRSEQQALSKYQQIKKGLMQDLLTGKVEVRVEEEILKNFRGQNEFS